MNSLVKQKFKEAVDSAAEEIVDAHIEEQSARAKADVFIRVGAARAAWEIGNIVGKTLMAKSLRDIEQIGKEKWFLDAGYETFADFLNNEPACPLRSSAFFAKLELLNKESDPIFDYLNMNGVSQAKRRLLGSGSIEFDEAGDVIVYPDENTQDGVRISKDDRLGLIELIDGVIRSRKAAKAETEKERKNTERESSRADAAEDKFNRLQATRSAEIAADPHMIAVVELQIAYRRLADAVDALSEADKKQFVFSVLEKIASCDLRLREAYGVSATVQSPTRSEPTGDDETDYINSLMDRVEADENDAALAAQI